jgi:uncharacterized membrane protein YfcA
MPLGLLKFVRFIVPAALILIFTKLLGVVTGWWNTTLPDFARSEFLPVVIIPAVIYYITPLRSWINHTHHARIAEGLRSGLVKITGYADQTEKYTWKKLRPLFFTLIDQDESLKKKASLAYANGAIWTSCADSTALAIIFFLISLCFYWLGVEDAFLAAILFAMICIASYAGSWITTSKQIGIGAEQLEIIELKYKSDIEKRLNALDK